MKKIDISTPKYPNTFTIVDNEDYERINKYKWWLHVNKKGDMYPETKIDGRIAILSRYVTDCPIGREVDHRNHNKLDNRKNNLRICTRSQNNMNHKNRKDNTSGYKGVIFNKQKNKWQSRINLNYKSTHLGFFTDKKDAAIAYNKAAKELFGEFAYLNEVTA